MNDNDRNYKFDRATETDWAQGQAIAEVRHAFTMVADLICGSTINSRERSNALKDLKTALMWTVDAIAHNGTTKLYGVPPAQDLKIAPLDTGSSDAPQAA